MSRYVEVQIFIIIVAVLVVIVNFDCSRLGIKTRYITWDSRVVFNRVSKGYS